MDKKQKKLITNRTGEELVALANNLSSNDMCRLIKMFSDRMQIYIGSVDKTCITVELSQGEFPPAGMNGTIIQLNTELANFDDIREDKFYADLLKMK